MRQSIVRNLLVSTQLGVARLIPEDGIQPQTIQRVKQLGFFGITFILIVVILACLGGAGLWVKTKINVLENEKLTLKVQNEQLVADNARILEVNKSNVFIIDKLNKDKERSNKIVSELKVQRQKDMTNLANLRTSIRQIIKNDPTQDGSLSPVLRQTLQNILDRRNPPAPVVKKGDEK
jgi:hypothetical protein